MTKIRSRNASRIQDRRGQGGAAGGGLGGLGDLLKGGLGGRGSGGGLPMPGGGGGLPGGLGGAGKLLKGGGGLMMILLLGAVFILPKVLGGDLGGGRSVARTWPGRPKRPGRRPAAVTPKRAAQNSNRSCVAPPTTCPSTGSTSCRCRSESNTSTPAPCSSPGTPRRVVARRRRRPGRSTARSTAWSTSISTSW